MEEIVEVGVAIGKRDTGGSRGGLGIGRFQYPFASAYLRSGGDGRKGISDVPRTGYDFVDGEFGAFERGYLEGNRVAVFELLSCDHFTTLIRQEDEATLIVSPVLLLTQHVCIYLGL